MRDTARVRLGTEAHWDKEREAAFGVAFKTWCDTSPLSPETSDIPAFDDGFRMGWDACMAHVRCLEAERDRLQTLLGIMESDANYAPTPDAGDPNDRPAPQRPLSGAIMSVEFWLLVGLHLSVNGAYLCFYLWARPRLRRWLKIAPEAAVAPTDGRGE